MDRKKKKVFEASSSPIDAELKGNPVDRGRVILRFSQAGQMSVAADVLVAPCQYDSRLVEELSKYGRASSFYPYSQVHSTDAGHTLAASGFAVDNR